MSDLLTIYEYIWFISDFLEVKKKGEYVKNYSSENVKIISYQETRKNFMKAVTFELHFVG